MLNSSYHYKGVVNIYLQGNEALEPVKFTEDGALYHLASPLSGITVNDHRAHVARAAKLALDGLEEDAFGHIFSQPASVEINAQADTAHIEIYDETTETEGLTLWMGVIDDHRMAVAETEWETLKAIEDEKIAFAALIH
jgi:hypothetical protein